MAALVAARDQRRENAENGSLLRTRCPTHESQTRPQKYLVMSWTNSVGSCKPPTRRWPSSRLPATKTARADPLRLCTTTVVFQSIRTHGNDLATLLEPPLTLGHLSDVRD